MNAWHDPNFRTALGRIWRKQFIMSGVTTDVCLIYSTILSVEAG